MRSKKNVRKPSLVFFLIHIPFFDKDIVSSTLWPKYLFSRDLYLVLQKFAKGCKKNRDNNPINNTETQGRKMVFFREIPTVLIITK